MREEIIERLRSANLAFNRLYPGDSGRRQPVHTVYGGAHLFKADTASRLGALALRALEEYAPEPVDLIEVADLSEELAPKVHERVIEKLRREPVEDFRADFEDGYGNRPDEEEDGHAQAVAREMAAGLAAGTLPPFIGIRIKPFTEELRERSFRTVELFLTALGPLPDNFVVTLPKVTIPEQVAALADLFDLLEPTLGLKAGTLRMEVMVETAQSILDAQGRCPLPLLVNAARGRCVAAHFGTYDYTASCSITAAHQSMDHPACDFAKHMMQVAFAGTGTQISDGATNVLPVPPHRGEELTAEQIAENRAVVHDAWWIHSQHIRHSLINAFYQGWDLHPAQLVTRYATVFAFFLEGLDAASERLHNFVKKAAQATLVGDVFDDAATGQGLLNYFLRAVNCGAISEEEALERSGLTLEELRGRSFVKILANRRG
ncbi:MAG TPA: phosphoenolpyruvate kinase [Thermoanaerobaculia bacterium]|jgi:citrate lyase beta subunit|nr:phosphoenolpyruvate kinase [Thermoanaerobaculia bacterium]